MIDLRANLRGLQPCSSPSGGVGVKNICVRTRTFRGNALHVVVVGGGLVGMFTSYSLLRAGFSVTLVDGHRGGRKASIYNAGLITPSLSPAPPIRMRRLIRAAISPVGPLYFSPVQVLTNLRWVSAAVRQGVGGSEETIVELGKRSLKIYNEFFREEGIDPNVIRGVVALYARADDARRAADAIGARFIDRDRAVELGFLGIEGGYEIEEEISLHPGRLCEALRRRLGEMGATLVASEGARLRSDGGRKVESVITEKEELHGDGFIATAGSWSRELCRPLGYDPMILPARGLVLLFDTGGARVIGRPALLEDYRIGVSQHDERTVRMTSFYELVGHNDRFGEGRRRWILDIARRHLKNYGALRLVEEGVGYRPCTPDGLPVIGRVPGYENLYIASGHCRVGATLAPVTGHLVTALLGGRESSEPVLKLLDPGRFRR